jgi:pimeloyl-ACP methyl ester carboxylesterase
VRGCAVTHREYSVETRLGTLRVLLPEEGVDLLLWPGLFLDHRLHLPLAQALARHGVRTGFIEPPGYGGSTLRQTHFTLADCGRAVVDVLDGLGLDRVSIGGTSWGGATSCWAGIVAPDRFHAVVAMNAPYVGGTRGRLPGLIPYAVRTLPLALFAEASASLSLGRSAWTSQRGAAKDLFVASLRTASARDRRSTAERVAWYTEPLLGQLPRLRVPALFLTGQQDRLCPARNAALAAAEAPQGLLLVSETTGHLTAWEDPTATAGQVAAFMAGAMGT